MRRRRRRLRKFCSGIILRVLVILVPKGLSIYGVWFSADVCFWRADRLAHRLSDNTGDLAFTEEARGKVSKSQLDSKDVFVFDSGLEGIVFGDVRKGCL